MNEGARVLILETSSRSLVGIARGDRVLAGRALDQARRNARDLAPTVAELLAEARWRPRDLEAVIVSLGPGSYTGLRVGIMSAKALAYATGCALIGVETFAAVAAQAPPDCSRLDVIADAQKDHLYLQSFVGGGASARPAGPLAIVQFAQWAERLEVDVAVSGPGLTKFAARLPPAAARVPADQAEPGLEALLALGLRRYRSGERDDPFTLGPIYHRPSSAEQQWRR